VRITPAPSLLARRAVSSPMPALPPITTTVCPSSCGSRSTAMLVAGWSWFLPWRCGYTLPHLSYARAR
jgi:hypothetical protein